jgi:hypothetical protein
MLEERNATEAMLVVASLITRRIELGNELAGLVKVYFISHLNYKIQFKDAQMNQQIRGACESLDTMLPELVLCTKGCLQHHDRELMQSEHKRLEYFKF